MFEGFDRTEIETSGTTINLVHGGDGPPVLLLHGYPQTHVMWHKVAVLLADHFTVVAPDLRGYGDSGKPPSDGDLSIYCKRTMAQDQVEVMAELGFQSYHVAGHDRGARVGHRMALDHPRRVKSFTSLDVVPSQAAFDSMDADLAFAWFHWNLMRQPAPLPEILISNSAKTYLDFLLESWTAVEGAITDEAYSEYLRCFSNPETIRGTCMDYRSIELDLQHDEADRGRKLTCPVLVLWAGNMAKRPGWQVGARLNMLDTWRERATDVRGGPIDCGHFLSEEAPDEVTDQLLGFWSR
ncbi:MAG: alpha/beta hydrolase [SAR202 cluster bacterium]|jgi:haloacetate dehalogenase|nr:alpha/beta hydrolase [SAR202 cluster bacterium]